MASSMLEDAPDGDALGRGLGACKRCTDEHSSGGGQPQNSLP
jgi:hypothetical protein